MKQIDETAGRLGMAMRNARYKNYIPQDEIARLLHITPGELNEYERGHEKIPYDIMERVFLFGYRMIQIRTLESMYRRQRKMFNKFNQHK